MFAFGSLLAYSGFLLKFNSCRLSSFFVLVFIVWIFLWFFKHLQSKLELKEIYRSSSRSILAKRNSSAKHSWQALLLFFYSFNTFFYDYNVGILMQLINKCSFYCKVYTMASPLLLFLFFSRYIKQFFNFFSSKA